MKIEFYHIDAFEVPNYEPIWRGLKKLGVDARLVAVPGNRNTANAGWFDFERFKQYCAERELPFTTEVDPTANLAITTQNIDILRNYSCPKLRIMYGPIMYPLAWGLQEHTIKPFSAVLTHAKIYTDFYSKWLPAAQLPIVGYPRYDDFFAGKLSRNMIRKRWGVADDKPVIVFLPTWGKNTGFDLFLPALLRLTEQYQVILRPHHCTLRLEPHRLALMKASGLLILDNAFELAEVYAGADLVIADMRSGALFEACLCNIPTVGMVLDTAELSGWIGQYNLGQMLSLCTHADQLESAIKIALTSAQQAEHRQHWAEQHVAFRDGTAGDEAAKALVTIATQPIKTLLPGLKAVSIHETNFNHN